MTDEQVDPLVPAALRGFGFCFRTARVAPEEAVFRPALPLRHLPVSIGTTMTKMTYGEQLKHPQWQRRRLEILSRAKFACEMCLDPESTLHVHHKHYVKGRMAWEYSDGELIALCENCHAEEHDFGELLGRVLASVAVDGISPNCIAAGLLAGLAAARDGIDDAVVEEIIDTQFARIAFDLGLLAGCLGTARLALAAETAEFRSRPKWLADAVKRRKGYSPSAEPFETEPIVIDFSKSDL